MLTEGDKNLVALSLYAKYLHDIARYSEQYFGYFALAAGSLHTSIMKFNVKSVGGKILYFYETFHIG
jgi:hypothetical protein